VSTFLLSLRSTGVVAVHSLECQLRCPIHSVTVAIHTDSCGASDNPAGFWSAIGSIQSFDFFIDMPVNE
jgi:hypothetical protein